MQSIESSSRASVGVVEGRAAPGVASDAEIVRRVRGGDVAAFEILMRRHNQRVYRAIRSVLRGDEADAEDAMQQTWLQAYRGLGGFEGASAFSTWLTRIALHVALARVRRRTRLAAVPGDGDPEPGPTPEDGVARREAMAVLERAVDRLPEAQRMVFVLREVEQLSTAEAADALGTSEENVKVRLHRARLALRDLLADEVGLAAPHAFTFLAPRCDRIVSAVLAEVERGGAP